MGYLVNNTGKLDAYGKYFEDARDRRDVPLER